MAMPRAIVVLEKERKVLISLALMLLFHTQLVICMEVLVVDKGKEGEVLMRRSCEGRTGDCLLERGMEMEMEMDSEISRRQLWAATQKKYISYDALKGDVVPCSKPGVPYYNCRALPKANPYTRGCSMISACRHSDP